MILRLHSIDGCLPVPYIYHPFQRQISEELGLEAHFSDPALFAGKQTELQLNVHLRQNGVGYLTQHNKV